MGGGEGEAEGKEEQVLGTQAAEGLGERGPPCPSARLPARPPICPQPQPQVPVGGCPGQALLTPLPGSSPGSTPSWTTSWAAARSTSRCVHRTPGPLLPAGQVHPPGRSQHAGPQLPGPLPTGCGSELVWLPGRMWGQPGPPAGPGDPVLGAQFFLGLFLGSPRWAGEPGTWRGTWPGLTPNRNR